MKPPVNPAYNHQIAHCHGGALQVFYHVQLSSTMRYCVIRLVVL